MPEQLETSLGATVDETTSAETAFSSVSFISSVFSSKSSVVTVFVTAPLQGVERLLSYSGTVPYSKRASE